MRPPYVASKDNSVPGRVVIYPIIGRPGIVGKTSPPCLRERLGLTGGVLESIGVLALVQVAKPVIAIVEDDPSMLKGVGRLLSAHGFLTEAYTSAEAFLEHAAATEASCLLLDINLGGISGIELSHRLAAGGSKLPVIFMTAVDSENVKREAISAGCIAYLRKPFPSRQLIDAIGRAVG